MVPTALHCVGEAGPNWGIAAFWKKRERTFLKLCWCEFRFSYQDFEWEVDWNPKQKDGIQCPTTQQWQNRNCPAQSKAEAVNLVRQEDRESFRGSPWMPSDGRHMLNLSDWSWNQDRQKTISKKEQFQRTILSFPWKTKPGRTLNSHFLSCPNNPSGLYMIRLPSVLGLREQNRGRPREEGVI